MRIEKFFENKKQFLDLLLLADEQEDMIDKYLPSGDLFALYDGDLKSVCVVVPINSEICELKNIATYEKYQGKGYGRALINFTTTQCLTAKFNLLIWFILKRTYRKTRLYYKNR
jgi:GNAT superfamily N-acetyltransferase